MSSIYGREIHAIDHKGRVSIPATMRKSGAKKPLDAFHVLKGLDGCVALYPPDEFAHVEERLRRLPLWDRRSRIFTRMFLLDAQKVSVDAQGRIMLSPALIEWAQLKKDAMVLGQGNRIEIWDPKRFDGHLATSPDSLEQLMAEVFKDERS